MRAGCAAISLGRVVALNNFPADRMEVGARDKQGGDFYACRDYRVEYPNSEAHSVSHCTAGMPSW